MLRGTALLFVMAASLALAQVENASITGTIQDSGGANLAGAEVVAKNLGMNREFKAKTNEAGEYLLPSVPLGRYIVTASQPQFRSSASGEIQAHVGSRLRADFVLSLESVAQTVSVEAPNMPLVETESSARGQVIEGQQIRELPLNKRDYTQLVLLSPGAVREPRHRLGGAMNINGNRALQNNFLLDGADNNANTSSFRGERVDVIRPSVDSIAEFKVQTNSYSAEYGRSAGAVINVVTKSGGNGIHGTLWEFFRNEKLDAHGWTPTNPSDLKPKLRFNQYGANVGGPLQKNKIFYFVNYQGERERAGQTYIGSVPTLVMTQGLLSSVDPRASAALRETPIDPTTGNPFPNGQIPRSRWDPVSVKVLSDPSFPSPTTNDGTIGNNYNRTVTNVSRAEQFDVRLDRYFGERVRVFGRYSFSDLELFRPTIFPGLAEGSTNDAFGTTATRGQNVAMGPTWTINPTTFFEGRLGYTRLAANVFPANSGSASPTALLGIPNLPTDPRVIGGWPRLAVEGLSTFGRATSTPQFQIPNVYLGRAMVTLLRGLHNLRVGFDGQYIQTAILDMSALIGVFSFNRNAFTNNSWADFLIGTPNIIRLTSYETLYNRKSIQNYFAQDDWRIRKDLTLNLGLRYEYGTPIVEKFNRIANFDRLTGTQRFAKDGGLADRALVQPDRLNFSPRIGLAWSPISRLSLRSGYGIFYNHTNRQGREGLLGMNPPWVKDYEPRQTRSTPDYTTLSMGIRPDFFNTASGRDLYFRGNDPNLRNGYVQQWNLTLQYRLFGEWVAEAAYVGNRGNRLTRFYDANQATVGGAQPLTERRPFTNYGTVQFMDSGATSNFHSLQTRLERRFGNGLSFLHSFTYGRGLESATSWAEGLAGPDINPQKHLQLPQ